MYKMDIHFTVEQHILNFKFQIFMHQLILTKSTNEHVNVTSPPPLFLKHTQHAIHNKLTHIQYYIL